MRTGLLALLFLPALAAAQQPAVNPNDALTATAFQHFYNLEYPEALTAFRAELAQHPDSPQAYNHVAQTILFREMFRSGALESELVTGANPFLRREGLKPSKADAQEFQNLIARAITLSGGRLKINPNDVPSLYALGVSYALRSNYHFLVEKSYVDALRDATAARTAHNRVTELDPSIADARLVQGLYDYILGSLPAGWKMLGFFAGFRGDRERGIETLKLVADKGTLNRDDAAVLLCAVYRRERKPVVATALLNDLIQRYPRNFIFRMELVQMYGDLGEKDKALAVIAQVDQLKRAQAPGYQQLQEAKIRYTRGNVLFWYNDLDRALDDMKAVTASTNEIDLNTGVYAWLRLGQIYDLQRKRKEAVQAYQQTVVFAPTSDASQLAQGYLLSRYKR